MKLKLRSRVKFLASIFDGLGTLVRKDGLAAYVDLDYTRFSSLNVATNPALTVVLAWDGTSFFTLPVSGVAASKQYKTVAASGAYTALPTDDVIIATVPPLTVNVDWSSRFKSLTVVDGSGGASTNNITIVPAAGQTQLAIVDYHVIIDGNGASVTLTPLPAGTGAY